MSFARNFHFGKEGKYGFQFRAEFQNIFNRLFLSAPATGAITTAAGTAGGALSSGGYYTSGYGYVATAGGAGAQPRNGQLIGRFTF